MVKARARFWRTMHVSLKTYPKAMRISLRILTNYYLKLIRTESEHSSSIIFVIYMSEKKYMWALGLQSSHIGILCILSYLICSQSLWNSYHLTLYMRTSSHLWLERPTMLALTSLIYKLLKTGLLLRVSGQGRNHPCYKA